MRHAKMELSIIITNYKYPELLKICIDSIKKNLTFDHDSYEVIVADSESEEKTEMMMREDYPEITFLPFEKNVGFQYLVKKAYAKTKGKYILILNGDILIRKNSIERLLDFIKKTPEVGICGPKLLNFNETLQLSCFRFYKPWTIVLRRTFLGKLRFSKKHLDWFLMKEFDHKSKKEVDWLMGSALLTKREAIEKVGEMDSRFKMYLEDTDWCRRFWENGYSVVYFPESQMYHYHGRGSAGKSVLSLLMSNRLAWLHIFSGLKFFWKYAGKPLPKHG
jgi:N-acetylglucosaminyl-diphospho-decaprenol L-rhamnosyltransferase